MATSSLTRADRIELRATKEEKRLLAAAAAYERLDVTSFIMRNVLPAAREVVEHAERIVLSARDSARVLKLLENPPKPSPALLAAARRRAQRK
ncbi:MAG: type II toxin-antitoxin system TacA family antitoxin [Acidiferrobacterales bacterium]